MARPTRGVAPLLLLLTCAAAAAAAAQAPEGERSLRLAVENDLIALRGAGAPPDHDYTHGTRMAAAWIGAPAWVRRLMGGKPARLYALAGYRQELVFRDLFVEGNTLRESGGGERRTAVGQFEVGVGVRRRTVTIEYRHVARGREYRAQPAPHAHGALVLALHEF